jgi:hypothetical protein
LVFVVFSTIGYGCCVFIGQKSRLKSDQKNLIRYILKRNKILKVDIHHFRHTLKGNKAEICSEQKLIMENQIQISFRAIWISNVLLKYSLIKVEINGIRI